MKRQREEESKEVDKSQDKDTEGKNDVSAPLSIKNEFSDDDDDQTSFRRGRGTGKATVKKGSECPYLDMISRQNLDFDFEKCCSVSLSRTNVYVCLVCGKCFQGRGVNTYAYTHSLESNHHMFMKLDSGRVYCLPDNYEVLDSSLDDIRHVRDPKFSSDDMDRIRSGAAKWSLALDGAEYMPGLMGLSNEKAHDYANCVVQLLVRVPPLRDFLLDPANTTSTPATRAAGTAAGSSAVAAGQLVPRLGELCRKLWNARAFRGQVSPHEFIQAMMASSSKRFTMDVRSDPVAFWTWIVNAAHTELTMGGREGERGRERERSRQGNQPDNKSNGRISMNNSQDSHQSSVVKSIFTDCFQGELEVTTLAGTGKARASNSDLVTRVPFWILSMDLPPVPLFKDALDREKTIIPQVPIFQLLTKFDGFTVSDDFREGRRRFRIQRLPKYLAVQFKRFVKNKYFIEKNPTIVNFPIKNLDLKDFLSPEALELDVKRRSSAAAAAARAAAIARGSTDPKIWASEAAAAKKKVEEEGPMTTYDLIGNVVHEGSVKEGSYKVHIHRKAEEMWYEVQDLRVVEILPQMVALSEAYFQLYELKEPGSAGRG